MGDVLIRGQKCTVVGLDGCIRMMTIGAVKAIAARAWSDLAYCGLVAPAAAEPFPLAILTSVSSTAQQMFLDSFTHAFCHPEQAEGGIEDDVEVDDSTQPSTAGSHASPSPPASHVLLLRDGLSSTSHSSSSSSLCCPSFGSRAVLRHFLVHCLRSSSIERVVLLSLLFPHSHFAYLADSANHNEQTAKQKLTVIDAVSALTFPLATATSDSSTSILQPARHPDTSYESHLTCSSLSDLSSLQAALQMALPSTRSHSVLIVDGLSTLLLYHSPPSLLRWLLDLRALPNVSLLLHADYACHEALGDSTWAAALSRIAGTRITTTAVRQERVIQQTSAVTNMPQSYAAAALNSHSAVSATETVLHTTITAHIAHTRASGRTAAKQEQYLLQPNSLTLAATGTTAAASAQPPTDDITSTLHSLMVDEAVAERQRQARAALVLPYAHQGDVRVGYGAGGLEVRRVVDEVGLDEDELMDDEEDDVDEDLDI